MEDLEKDITAKESDPASIDARRLDEPGSFLDIYRSIAIESIHNDMEFVDYCVKAGVIPASVRYGAMRRGQMLVYRGVVKSLPGDLFYFNWTPGADFKLVPADDMTKKWEADKMFKSCTFGCDIRKAEAPLDPGESVEDDEEDHDDLEKMGRMAGRPAGALPIPEAQAVAQQQSVMTTQHPGAAGGGTTPDNLNVGRDWHKSITHPADTAQVGTNDGVRHWTGLDLVKAVANKLHSTTPTVQPSLTPLEHQFLTQVMGYAPDQITKGMKIPPRQRLNYENWKSDQLRGKLNGLNNWIKKQG